jgi:hypothetical protein
MLAWAEVAPRRSDLQEAHKHARDADAPLPLRMAISPTGIQPERGGDEGQIRPAGEAGRSPEIETVQGRGDVSPRGDTTDPRNFFGPLET